MEAKLISYKNRLRKLDQEIPVLLNLDSISIDEVIKANPGFSEREAKEYLKSLKEIEPGFRSFVIKCNKEPIRFEGWENIKGEINDFKH